MSTTKILKPLWFLTFLCLGLSACSDTSQHNTDQADVAYDDATDFSDTDASDTPNMPTNGMIIKTNAVTDIGTTRATFHGELTGPGQYDRFEYGFCYGPSENPTPENSTCQTLGILISGQEFRLRVNYLRQNTRYHVRAFITDSLDTYYGRSISFTTTDAIPLTLHPKISTILNNHQFDITTDPDARVINIKNIDAGTWYGFSLHEQHDPAEQFSCEQPTANTTVLENNLFIDLPLQKTDGVQSISCKTSNGPLRIHFYYNASDIMLASGNRMAWIHESNLPPNEAAISGDGEKIAWLLRSSGISQIFVSGPHYSLIQASTTSQGLPANQDSYQQALSFDGRYVVFTSRATNLVDPEPDPSYLIDHIYLKDLQTGALQRISQNQNGEPGDRGSSTAAISADGQHIVFASAATNLLDEPLQDAHPHIYHYDVAHNKMTRLKPETEDIGSDKTPPMYAPSISADGKFVAFQSHWPFLTNGHEPDRHSRIYRYDLTTQKTLLVSQAANGEIADLPSANPALSADGRFVVFESSANNLLYQSTGSNRQLFRKDMETGEVILVTQSEQGVLANANSVDPAISADGRYVAFISAANNLVRGIDGVGWRIYRKDLLNGNIIFLNYLPSPPHLGIPLSASRPAISANGRLIAFNTAELAPSNPEDADNRSIYLYDSHHRESILISDTKGGANAEGYNSDPVISANNKYAFFTSEARNLVPKDGLAKNPVYIYAKNLESGEITFVCENSDGIPANGTCTSPMPSADGRYVLFNSTATNLVPSQPIGTARSYIYRKDMRTKEVTRISKTHTGTLPIADSFLSAVSADAKYILFYSTASNLVPQTTSRYRGHLYRQNLETGEILRVSQTATEREFDSVHHVAAISTDGKFVVLSTNTGFLVPYDGAARFHWLVFGKNLETNEFTLISQTANGIAANYSSHTPSISDDGRYVVFQSESANLTPGSPQYRTQIYRKDLQTGELLLVSQNASGMPGNDKSTTASIDRHARFVTFQSTASNLLPGTTTEINRTYRKDLQTGTLTLLTDFQPNPDIPTTNFKTTLSPDGTHAIFRIDRPHILPGPGHQLFIRRLHPD